MSTYPSIIHVPIYFPQRSLLSPNALPLNRWHLHFKATQHRYTRSSYIYMVVWTHPAGIVWPNLAGGAKRQLHFASQCKIDTRLCGTLPEPGIVHVATPFDFATSIGPMENIHIYIYIHTCIYICIEDYPNTPTRQDSTPQPHHTPPAHVRPPYVSPTPVRRDGEGYWGVGVIGYYSTYLRMIYYMQIHTCIYVGE
jgi:hypothetical protein